MKAKPESKEQFVPSALRQVWEWKDAIYQETKHLPPREALHEILRQARELVIGFLVQFESVLLIPCWVSPNAGK